MRRRRVLTRSLTAGKGRTVAEPVPATLRAYRLLTSAALPLVPRLIARRVKRGKEHPARIGERRGETSVVRPPGPLIWVHGASVGELLSAIPLIERIRARNFAVLVTSGTITSAGIAAQRLPPGVIHQFAPFDLPQFVTRFLDHWKPDLALLVESDLWPNLILAATERGIPLIMVNGRVSERSYRRWRWLPGTIASLLRRFDLCLAQSTLDAQRYEDLGAPRITMTGNLKLDAPPPPADESKLAAVRSAIADRPVIAATSTHPGEEAMLVDAHRRLRGSFPGLLTTIAPRHPERGRGIVEIAAASGLNAIQRSRGHLPDRGTDIYVCDTVGELGLVYRLAPIVFVGGSLASRGGQNPIEAIKLGAAVLHGPHVWNFAEIYDALGAAHGAEMVTDANKLAVRIGAWLTDPAARQRSAASATAAIGKLCGALERTLAALDPYLMQLQLEQRSGDA